MFSSPGKAARDDKPEREPGAEAPGKRRKRGIKEEDESKLCFAARCPHQALVGKRWCHSCNKKYDNAMYQAKKAGEVDAANTAFEDPESAASYFDQWEIDNPSDQRYQRKKLINWAQFKRKYCVRRVNRDRSGSKPYEFTQWLKHGCNVMGWSEKQTKAEWERHRD